MSITSIAESVNNLDLSAAIRLMLDAPVRTQNYQILNLHPIYKILIKIIKNTESRKHMATVFHDIDLFGNRRTTIVFGIYLASTSDQLQVRFFVTACIRAVSSLAISASIFVSGESTSGCAFLRH